jgi:putative salt-induced outer membrane protein YdiY
VLKNGDVIVGDLKSLDAGVAVLETDYSKNDFTIEWDGVRRIFSPDRYTITLENGDRVTGSIRSTADGVIVIDDSLLGTTRSVALSAVVLLKGVEDDFWSRLVANIDVGLSVQKENSLTQFNSQSMLGYLVDKWEISLTYNANRSTQDSIADIERTEAVANAVYLLPRDWYLQGTVSGLSNTEQSLDLRLQGKAGAGKYLVHTNQAYLRTGLGLSRMREQYVVDTLDKFSLEGFFGAELNLFDIGDLDLHTQMYAYPGISETGRWRVDFDFNLKYDLLQDFYLKLSTTINYDNKPAVAGTGTYYVYGFSVGWELD